MDTSDYNYYLQTKYLNNPIDDVKQIIKNHYNMNSNYNDCDILYYPINDINMINDISNYELFITELYKIIDNPIIGGNTQQQPSFNTQKQPSFNTQQQPSFNTQRQPSFNTQQQMGFNTQRQPSFNTQQQMGFNTQRQPSFNTQHQPSFNTQQQMGFNTQQQMGFNTQQQMGFNTQRQPGFNTQHQPGFNTQHQHSLNREYFDRNILEENMERRKIELREKKIRQLIAYRIVHEEIENKNTQKEMLRSLKNMSDEDLADEIEMCKETDVAMAANELTEPFLIGLAKLFEYTARYCGKGDKYKNFDKFLIKENKRNKIVKSLITDVIIPNKTCCEILPKTSIFANVLKLALLYTENEN